MTNNAVNKLVQISIEKYDKAKKGFYHDFCEGSYYRKNSFGGVLSLPDGYEKEQSMNSKI